MPTALLVMFAASAVSFVAASATAVATGIPAKGSPSLAKRTKVHRPFTSVPCRWHGLPMRNWHCPCVRMKSAGINYASALITPLIAIWGFHGIPNVLPAQAGSMAVEAGGVA